MRLGFAPVLTRSSYHCSGISPVRGHHCGGYLFYLLGAARAELVFIDLLQPQEIRAKISARFNPGRALRARWNLLTVKEIP
jgi:hypothetical protein